MGVPSAQTNFINFQKQISSFRDQQIITNILYCMIN